ncbi:hypothetical protein [Candidatus Nanohalococcus occultus]|uniref:Uncharacterized protein n=1 Tax=Candidatus Nanohalococcus occultus TaxID=2978047 RepID=A0ABY8CEC3_9ARCH|nr:hypothetical protein SVXNc_0524 [Candidatus Nanohaloarchaeota archaeon SVXNc]
MEKSFKSFLEELFLSLFAMTATAMVFAGLFFLGDRFSIGFLQSNAGIIVSTLILGEVFFFTVLGYMVLKG